MQRPLAWLRSVKLSPGDVTLVFSVAVLVLVVVAAAALNHAPADPGSNALAPSAAAEAPSGLEQRGAAEENAAPGDEEPEVVKMRQEEQREGRVPVLHPVRRHRHH
jgi:hypothetical protein